MGSLCIGCGLCCDGTLFRDTGLSASDDLQALAAVGLVADEGRIPQPCPRFESGRCGCYEARPGACRRYRCKLLRQVEGGQLAEEPARAMIDVALGLADAARRAGPLQERASPAPTLLAHVALEGYLRLHFRDSKTG